MSSLAKGAVFVFALLAGCGFRPIEEGEIEEPQTQFVLRSTTLLFSETEQSLIVWIANTASARELVEKAGLIALVAKRVVEARPHDDLSQLTSHVELGDDDLLKMLAWAEVLTER